MPTIGKDLAKIRKYLGFTIQDIQKAIKIPVNTIQAIEDNSIFTEFSESKTYIRSFIRSYGKTLKIDDQILIKALDQQETGNYNHLLIEQFPQLIKKNEPAGTPDQTEIEQKEASEKHETPSTDTSGDHKQAESNEHLFSNIEESGDTASSKQNDEVNEATPEKKQQSPDPIDSVNKKTQLNVQEKSESDSVKNVDWANMGKKFKEENKPKTGWVFGLILILSIATATGYFLYQNGFFDFFVAADDTPIEEPQSTQGRIVLDIDEPETNFQEHPQTVPADELENVLYVTVYAAYDVLAPVRVWSDLKPRMDPYWIEQGVGLNFEFQDTIRIRGQYNNSLLFLNGHLIEDAYEEHYNSAADYIELTRNQFTNDPKWARSVSIEIPEGAAPPDSISDRPSF